MTNRELDCLIIGFATGSLACLWVGYWLRKRVERWHARRDARGREHDFPDVVGRGRRPSPPRPKHIPFGDLGGVPRSEQSARTMLTEKPRTIPLEKRQLPFAKRQRLTPIPVVPHEVAGYPTHYAADPHNVLPCDPLHDQEAAKTARIVREDAIAALTDTGWKRATAVEAVDACTLDERAGGLESWVAAAFRRATSKG